LAETWLNVVYGFTDDDWTEFFPGSLQDAGDDAEGGDWFYFLHRTLLETLQRVTVHA
jgi:hypothetical protein